MRNEGIRSPLLRLRHHISVSMAANPVDLFDPSLSSAVNVLCTSSAVEAIPPALDSAVISISTHAPIRHVLAEQLIAVCTAFSNASSRNAPGVVRESTVSSKLRKAYSCRQLKRRERNVNNRRKALAALARTQHLGQILRTSTKLPDICFCTSQNGRHALLSIWRAPYAFASELQLPSSNPVV